MEKQTCGSFIHRAQFYVPKRNGGKHIPHSWARNRCFMLYPVLRDAMMSILAYCVASPGTVNAQTKSQN